MVKAVYQLQAEFKESGCNKKWVRRLMGSERRRKIQFNWIFATHNPKVLYNSTDFETKNSFLHVREVDDFAELYKAVLDIFL